MTKAKTYQDYENALIDLGLDVISADKDCIRFWLNENTITFWVKRQWASGRGIEDGRGWQKLYDQLKKITQ